MGRCCRLSPLPPLHLYPDADGRQDHAPERGRADQYCGGCPGKPHVGEGVGGKGFHLDHVARLVAEVLRLGKCALVDPRLKRVLDRHHQLDPIE